MIFQRNHAPGLSWPFNELSDETLLQALAEGATWAMEPLYQRYHRILYALAYRLVVDTQVAEDLVQEAFLFARSVTTCQLERRSLLYQ
jgi:RNA polymerase sigma-70 factor (ECF subfamily)